ncbi:hypothetical protein ABLX65_22935, partial [Klebsiella sp. JB_Kp008]
WLQWISLASECDVPMMKNTAKTIKKRLAADFRIAVFLCPKTNHSPIYGGAWWGSRKARWFL